MQNYGDHSLSGARCSRSSIGYIIFIIAGGPVSEKTEGCIRAIDNERLLPPKTRSLISEIYTLAERSMDAYLQDGDDNFAFAISGLARFHVNAYRQRGSMAAAVIRDVSFVIPDWKNIYIPKHIMDLADISNGVILMTGTAGSGKSTTQACIIDRINKTRYCHIITLEDPIEFYIGISAASSASVKLPWTQRTILLHYGLVCARRRM